MTFKKLCQLLVVLFACLSATKGYVPEEPKHFNATLGEDVILLCDLEFSDNKSELMDVRWFKQGIEEHIYLWNIFYPGHSGVGYEGRLSLSRQASLNLTNVRLSDQGWYECRANSHHRLPEFVINGSWVHLDVHVPSEFKMIPPEAVYVKVGESVTLPCEAEGTPPPNLTWYKDNSLLEESRTVQILPNKLRINNLLQADTGDYTCMIRTNQGTVTATSKVRIAGSAFIVVPPRNVTRYVGGRAKLFCEAKALPNNVTHRWFHNGVEISLLPRLETRTVVRRGGTLFINPTSAEDSGEFTCEVTNGIGTPDTASAFLSVESSPHFKTKPPDAVFVKVGESVTLPCEAEGTPFPIIAWYKNNWLLRERRNVQILPPGLKIKYSLQEDAGDYTCMARNKHGTVTATCKVRIAGYVPEEPKRYTATLGEDVILFCGFEFPENKSVPHLIEWHKQGIKIPIYIWYGGYPPHSGVGYEGRVSVAHQASLNLTKVRETDQGWYECRVHFLNRPPDFPKNGTWVHLDVHGPASIVAPPRNSTKLEGGRAEFDCRAKALPTNVTHRWFHNGVEISQLPRLVNRTVVRRDGTLILNPISAEDSGEFTCEVTNGIGTPDTASAFLSVEFTTPHAPTNVTVNTSSDASTLTWLPAFDVGQELTHVIRYRVADQGDSDWQIIEVYPDGAISFTAYNLQADTEYEFQVLSRNKLGNEMFSPIVGAKTKR